MPYLSLKGNLGVANTKIYGLAPLEIDMLEDKLRLTSKNEEKGEVKSYNAVMFVINQLEYHLGYYVISSTKMEEQILWVLHRPLDPRGGGPSSKLP